MVAGRGLLLPFFHRYSVDRSQPSSRATSSMLGETASISREMSEQPATASISNQPLHGERFLHCANEQAVKARTIGATSPKCSGKGTVPGTGAIAEHVRVDL